MTAIDIPFRTGCLLVLSDLHHDHFARQRLDPFAAHGLHQSLRWTADALILAGDLADTPARNWLAAFAFLRRYMSPRRTFVLAGNHDYYGHRLDGDEDLRALAQAAGVQFVQKQELRHGSTRIFACTLWTDFTLTNAPQASMTTAGRVMRYYSAISKHDPEEAALPSELAAWRRPVPITPHDTLAVHRDHRAWLEAALSPPHFAGPGERSVVVTHHGPHPATAGAIDHLSAAFHSDLNDLIHRHWPDVWFFGHSHRRLRAMVGATDIRNVSIGYPNEGRTLGEQPLSDLCQLFGVSNRRGGADDAALLSDLHPLRLWSAGQMTTRDACTALGLRDRAALLVEAGSVGLAMPMPPEAEIARQAELIETLVVPVDARRPVSGAAPDLSEAAWVDFLRNLKLPVVTEAGVGLGIRRADVPAEMRDAFDHYMLGAGCPVIAGEPCVWLHDWQLFLSARTRRALHALSLRLGAKGPGEADLQAAPLLSDWIAVRDPHFGGAILLGTPTGHPTCRGPLSHTSRLCGIDPSGTWARTVSRWYRLARMSNFDTLSRAHGGRIAGAADLVLTLDEVQSVIKDESAGRYKRAFGAIRIRDKTILVSGLWPASNRARRRMVLKI